MGMNALFVGSEDNIILDKNIAQKFKIEFITKLARRSLFVYPSRKEFKDAMIEYNSYEDMKKRTAEFEMLAKSAKAYIGNKSMEVAQTFLDSDKRLLTIDDDALDMYKDYKMYCNALGNGLDYLYKSVQLEQTHRAWKMLKLAGIFAMWDLRDNISSNDIEEAIYIVEKFGRYMEEYELYASKFEYEHLVDFFVENPEYKFSLHELKKRGFISGTTNLNSKVNELVRLADSYAGNKGMVEYKGDIVSWKPFEKVGNHGASYVEVSGSKQERAFKCHSGFIYQTTTFDKLKNLMCNDTAYTPFKFKDGKRSNDNIASGATWCSIDVDETDIDIYEMHDILGDFNHHIATTSNRDNLYKYRILIEFNTVVDIPPREWKSFMSHIYEELGIPADPASHTKSQIMFGYKGALVLTNLEGEPYDVTEAMKFASQNVMVGEQKRPTLTQARRMLDDPLNTFSYAFNDNVKSRSLTMYRMARHAYDLGANCDEIEQLMKDLNNFWVNPISEERLESYIKQQRRLCEESE
jgi:hypothetical protein